MKQAVLKGDLLLLLVDPKETIEIRAVENCIIVKQYLQQGCMVAGSGRPLCLIEPVYLTESPQPNKINVDTHAAILSQEEKVRLIEDKLIKIKSLYAKGLISESVYEARQTELVNLL